MVEPIVRPVREAEFGKVGELVVDAYAASGFLAGTETGYADTLRDIAHRAAHAEVLVATDPAGDLLGSVTVVTPGTPYAEVSRPGELEFRMLAVRADARGRGVGEALTQAVLRRARAAGAVRVVLCSLSTMTTAHRIYTRLGFQRLPERDWFPAPEVALLAFALELTGG